MIPSSRTVAKKEDLNPKHARQVLPLIQIRPEYIHAVFRKEPGKVGAGHAGGSRAAQDIVPIHMRHARKIIHGIHPAHGPTIWRSSADGSRSREKQAEAAHVRAATTYWGSHFTIPGVKHACSILRGVQSNRRRFRRGRYRDRSRPPIRWYEHVVRTQATRLAHFITKMSHDEEKRYVEKVLNAATRRPVEQSM